LSQDLLTDGFQTQKVKISKYFSLNEGNKLLIYTLLIPILITVVIGSFLMIKAAKKGHAFLIEYAILFLPILIWNYLLFTQVGPQSLANVIEVYILVFILLLYSLFRFCKSRLSKL